MVYNEEVFDGFVRESTRFTSWDEMVRTAADRAFSTAGEIVEELEDELKGEE